MKSALLCYLLAFSITAPHALAKPVQKKSAITFIPVEASNNSTLATRSGASDSYLQVFSGAECDGDAGPNQVFNQFFGPVCFANPDRHSFRVTGDCKDVRVSAQSDDTNCGGQGKAQNVANGCYTVNTGANWQSTIVYCRDPQPGAKEGSNP